MKLPVAYLVYTKRANDQKATWQVNSVYALPHSARAKASKLRKSGRFESFVLPRTVRGK
jgi:hypothetical protein